jgi:hypothetical protein
MSKLFHYKIQLHNRWGYCKSPNAKARCLNSTPAKAVLAVFIFPLVVQVVPSYFSVAAQTRSCAILQKLKPLFEFQLLIPNLTVPILLTGPQVDPFIFFCCILLQGIHIHQILILLFEYLQPPKFSLAVPIFTNPLPMQFHYILLLHLLQLWKDIHQNQTCSLCTCST